MKTAEEMRAYYRAHYAANKEKWREKRMRYEAKMRGRKLAAKDKPCTDCGGRWHSLVMEFDHLPGVEKCMNVGDAHVRAMGWERVRAEIAKCEVVCVQPATAFVHYDAWG